MHGRGMQTGSEIIDLNSPSPIGKIYRWWTPLKSVKFFPTPERKLDPAPPVFQIESNLLYSLWNIFLENTDHSSSISAVKLFRVIPYLGHQHLQGPKAGHRSFNPLKLLPLLAAFGVRDPTTHNPILRTDGRNCNSLPCKWTPRFQPPACPPLKAQRYISE